MGAVQLRDGGFVVVGKSTNLDDVSAALIIKLGEDGAIRWLKALGGDLNEEVCSVLQTDDDGLIVAGWTESLGYGLKDAWILKFDSQGNLEWEVAIGGTELDKACMIHSANDGGYIVLGETSSSNFTNTEIWILKINETGEIIWQNTYGGNSDLYGFCINSTKYGGYIISGKTFDPIEERTESMLLKVDDFGDIEWQRIYRIEGNMELECVRSTTDGGYITAGSINIENEYDAVILKTSADGSIEWARRFGAEGSEESAGSVTLSDEGHFVIAGRTEALGLYASDLMILNMTPSVHMEDCSFLRDIEVTSLVATFTYQPYVAYPMEISSFQEPRDLVSTSQMAFSSLCPQIQKKVKGKNPIR